MYLGQSRLRTRTHSTIPRGATFLRGLPVRDLQLYQSQFKGIKGKNKDMKTEDEEKDWTKVLFEVIIKILTLGFYHIEKHKKK